MTQVPEVLDIYLSSKTKLGSGLHCLTPEKSGSRTLRGVYKVKVSVTEDDEGKREMDGKGGIQE